MLRPLGYLAFAAALFALSAAARALGDRDELGFFCGRLARSLWAYPEVTRRGVQAAWLVWAGLFVTALTPADPLSTGWDEILLGAVALGVLWRRYGGGHRAGG